MGVITAPILVAVIKVANDKEILRDNVNSKLSNIFGWTAIVMIGISILISIFAWVLS
jgi:Mn2+/Fe2+ NRAMP family transporter